MKCSYLILLILIAVSLCNLGCGASDGKVQISGKVTWNGTPIKLGFITLKPLDGKHAPEAGQIKDGIFSFSARPGKQNVEIRAVVERGYNESMKQPNMVQFIPSEFNSRSTLTTEIPTDGKKDLDFTLVGKEL